MRLPRLAAFILASAHLAGAADAAPAAPRPLIGAQVWIEPGQTPDEIDGWFRTLAESGMPVAR
ncbi:MAG TPA: hypothetical protein VE359_13140, partial [Vicinamibacteria bacterium]|nr:hypothetical protein [Vicinamibacteria bacterium]